MKRVMAAALAVGLAAGGARAQSWAINRVADTTTVSPGGAVFGSSGGATFSKAALGASGDVAFFGAKPVVGNGVFRTQSGGLVRIADQTTGVPGVSGATFDQGLTQLTFDGISPTFVGLSTLAGAGIYSHQAGAITTLVNAQTTGPGGGAFTNFGLPFRDGNAVAFGGTQSGVSGMYRWSGSGINTVVDTSTVQPGSGTAFAILSPKSLAGDRAVFFGSSASRSGVYERSAAGTGAVSVIADTSTPIPGGMGNFASFASGVLVSAQGPSTAFVAGTSQTTSGVFAQIDNQLLRIADTTTPGPSGELFVNFQAVAVSGNNVAFVALANNFKIELVVWRNGVMSTVASTGDFINGIRLEQIQMTSQALRGDMVAFSSYRFVGTPQQPDNGGVYTATYVPAPGTALILGLMMARRRRR